MYIKIALNKNQGFTIKLRFINKYILFTENTRIKINPLMTTTKIYYLEYKLCFLMTCYKIYKIKTHKSLSSLV